MVWFLAIHAGAPQPCAGSSISVAYNSFAFLMGVQSHSSDMPFKIVSNLKPFDGDPGVFWLLRLRARTSAKGRGASDAQWWACRVSSHLSVIRGQDTWRAEIPGCVLAMVWWSTLILQLLAKLGDTASRKQHEWWQWQRKGFSDSSFKHPAHLQNVQQCFVC